MPPMIPMTPAQRLAKMSSAPRTRNFFGAASTKPTTAEWSDGTIAPGDSNVSRSVSNTRLYPDPTPMAAALQPPRSLSNKQLRKMESPPTAPPYGGGVPSRPIGSRGLDGKCVPTAWAKQSCLAAGRSWDESEGFCLGSQGSQGQVAKGPCYLGEPDNLGARGLDGTCVPEKWAIQSCMASGGKWLVSLSACSTTFPGGNGENFQFSPQNVNPDCTSDNLAACDPTDLTPMPTELFTRYRWGVCDLNSPILTAQRDPRHPHTLFTKRPHKRIDPKCASNP
jgi:hypothetical protein